MLVWVLADNPSRYFYEAMGGKLLGSQEVKVGGVTLKEVAYGWENIRNLTERGEATGAARKTVPHRDG